jgi:uncharacterized protein YcnI
MSRAPRLRACACAVAVAAALVSASAGVARAHVLIRPQHAPPGTLVLFTVLSPDEKGVPLTGLRLSIPTTLVVSSIGDTAGYSAQIVRDQNFRPIALTWQGGHTTPAHLALFHFAALTPPQPATVTLTGVQTFADGSTRIWRNARVVIGDAPGDSSAGGDDHAILAAALAGAVLGAAALGLSAAALRRARSG